MKAGLSWNAEARVSKHETRSVLVCMCRIEHCVLFVSYLPTTARNPTVLSVPGPEQQPHNLTYIFASSKPISLISQNHQLFNCH